MRKKILRRNTFLLQAILWGFVGYYIKVCSHYIDRVLMVVFMLDPNSNRWKAILKTIRIGSIYKRYIYFRLRTKNNVLKWFVFILYEYVFPSPHPHRNDIWMKNNGYHQNNFFCSWHFNKIDFTLSSKSGHFTISVNYLK